MKDQSRSVFVTVCCVDVINLLNAFFSLSEKLVDNMSTELVKIWPAVYIWRYLYSGTFLYVKKNKKNKLAFNSALKQSS